MDDNSYRGHERDVPSGNMPDEFDRMLGVLDGVSTATQGATVPVVPTLGIGGTRKFIIQTIRHEGKDHLFIEMIGRERSFREYLPPAVTDVIARQHSALSTRNRRAGARRAAATRRAQGIVPEFTPEMRAKALKTRRAKAAKRRARRERRKQ